MRQRWQPRPEVRHDALGDRAQSDRLASRRPADALEPLGDALQALGVRFKMGDELAPRGIRILAEVINPPREAHQRRPELMRRLAGHRDPEPVACRRDAFPHRPRREQHETEKHRALQDGEPGERPGRRQCAVVDRAHARLDQRRLDAVQLRDPVATRDLVRVRAEWRVVERRDAAGRVGHRNGNAEPPDLVGEGEQRVGGGALARIVQAGEDVPQQPAGLASVVAKVPRDDPGIPDRQHAEE